MSQEEIQKAQLLVNSICDDFAKLGYGELPYPKVIREANEITESQTDYLIKTEFIHRDFLIKMFEFRKAAYFPFFDKIYIMLDEIESPEKDIKELLFHEFLHQVMNRNLMKNGYFFGFCSDILLDPRWQPFKYFLIAGTGLLVEHFGDEVVNQTLIEMGFKLHSTPSTGNDTHITETWSHGPFETYYERGIQLFDPDVQTMWWLVEGVEFYALAQAGYELCKNTLLKTAPKLYLQLQEIFRGLTVEVPSQTIVNRFGELCDVVALKIDYRYIWYDKRIHRTPETEKLRCQFVIEIDKTKVNEILKSFLTECKY
jgi:hypothetical protein